MANKRKIVATKETEIRTGRINEACARYSLGKMTMDKVASEAGAVIRIGKCKLYDFNILDMYFSGMAGSRY